MANSLNDALNRIKNMANQGYTDDNDSTSLTGAMSRILGDKYTDYQYKKAKDIYKQNESELNSYRSQRENLYKENTTPILNNQMNMPKYDSSIKLPTAGTNVAVETAKPVYEELNKASELPEIKKVQQDIKDKYRETAVSYDNYLNAKLANDDIGFIDKILGPVISGVGSILPSKYKLENEQGQQYSMQNYSERKQQKILDSYNTILGRYYGSATYELGKIGATTVVNAIGAAAGLPGIGTAAYFTDIFSDSYNRTLEEGYDKNDSLLYATINVALEYALDQFIGGTSKLLGMGSSELSSNLSSKLTEKILANHPRVANAIASAISEGNEEFVQEFFDKFVSSTLLDKNNAKTALKETFSLDTLSDAIYSGIVGSITGAVSGSMNKNYYNKVKVKDKNGKVHTEIIESSTKFNGNSMNDNVNVINGQNVDTDVKEEKPNIDSNINNDVQENTNIDNKVNSDIYNNVVENTSISNSLINATNDSKTAFKYMPTNDTKVNNLYQSASTSNFNNSLETIQLIDTATKLVKEKGYNILFDRTITNDNGESVNAKITTNPNNEVEIRINPDSKSAGEFLMVHEVSHAIKNKEMIELINDFASRNEKFAESVKEIETKYGKNLTSEEVFADVCGQLFGNEEFIQSLETKNTVESKNIIKQVYELLKHLLNKLTSEGRYRNFVQDLETKWRNAYRNTTMQQATNNLNGKNNFSKRMGGYFAEINTSINDIGKFKINNYDNLKEVKKKVFDYYKDSYISNEQISKPIENIDTGLKIEIWKSGINETFGNANYYKNLSLQDKKIKLATMDSLAKMIKYGEVRAKNTTNYHNAKSTAMYYYLEHPIIVDGTQYMVNMDIRKVPETNGRFYIHSINTKKIGTTGNSKSRPLTVPTSIDNIPQSNTKVNRDTSTKYSMQLNENNTNELDNSSFSLEQRIFGNELLDAQDLIEEIKSVGAIVDKNGYVTLYHQTTSENAEKIKQSGKMFAKEPYVYFSTSENASQSDGRGNTKLEFKIPVEKLELDDIFNDNADVKIKLNGSKELDVSNYIVNEGLDENLSNFKKDIEKYLMPEIYDRYKNEDKSKITETLEELKKYKDTLNPNESDEDWNKNFYTNQKIKALNEGFDNVYDYLVNHDKNELMKDYKYNPQKIEDKINKYKSKDNYAKMVNEDYKNATAKQQTQFDIIQETNPAPEESNYVWIRKPSDIKTFEEVINDKDSFTWGDYSKEDALRDLKKGTVTIYSSYPIKNGVFVSTSYQQALDYAGGDPSQVHSRKSSIDSVAWINGDEGQYAKATTKYSQNNSKWQAFLEENFKPTGTRTYFKDVVLKNNEVSKPSTKYSENLNSNKSNDVLKVIIDNKTQKKLEQLDTELKNIKDRYTKMYPNDRKQRDSKIKARAMEISAQKRNLIQGDWLIPIEKGLTSNELNNKINRLKSNYVGKEVIVDNNKGKVIGTSFGKIGVEFENGNTKYYEAADIKSVQDIDSIIKEQTKKYNQLITENKVDTTKKLNPIEISNLTKNDATTTPKLPKVEDSKVGKGESHYWSNINEKTNMLSDDTKKAILSRDDIKYYKQITNKESLNEAFDKLNKSGASETFRWSNIDSKTATATDVAEGWILLKQYNDAGDYDSAIVVAKKMKEMGTSAGQTVQAFNIMERMTPEGMVKYAQSELTDAYNIMVKNKTKEWIDKYRSDFDLQPNEVKFIVDTMKEVQNMEDGYSKKVKLAEIQKMMTDKLPPDKNSRLKSWMRISMLFNPKTQVRNVVGNALIMPVNSISDVISSKVDKIIAKKTGVRTTGTTDIKAMLKGIKKGAYEATNDYKKGINTKDMDGNRFEISNQKSFSEKNLIGKSLNRTEALLNYVMDIGDRVFSEAAFENSLQNQMTLNNTTEVTQEMIDIAHTEALQRTWNDNNNYTKFVLDVRRGLNRIKVAGYGLGDVLIPFAKTPANLTKAIVDYSPAGLVSTITKGINLKNSLSNGQYTAKMQHQFVQSLGKATAGTMLYVLGIALAKAGITSGESDDDKDTRDFIKNALGISSYSIKIGDKSFTYDWAQPIAAPLSITANVVNSKKNKETALSEAIVGSLDTAGSILLEQSFLSSLNDVLSDNDGVASGIVNEILELPSRAVPTFAKQIADLVDDTQRQTYEYDSPIKTAKNKIIAKLPGVSKTLSASVDTMGREIKKYGGRSNVFNVFLNPSNVNTKNISESAEEIYRLYKATGDQTIMPRVSPYYINQNNEKVILNTEQRANYSKVSGQIIEDNLKILLSNNNYQKLNDTEKSEIVKNIVDYSYNVARKEITGIEMSNTYNKVNFYTSTGGKVSDYYLAKNKIAEIKEEYAGQTKAKKANIFKYINGLNLSKAQKILLFNATTTYSIKEYKNYMFNYINNLKITKSEKEKIWNELYGKD